MGAGTVSLWFIKIIICVIECENIDYVKVFVASSNENALKRCQEECPKVASIKLDSAKFYTSRSQDTCNRLYLQEVFKKASRRVDWLTSSLSMEPPLIPLNLLKLVYIVMVIFM